MKSMTSDIAIQSTNPLVTSLVTCHNSTVPSESAAVVRWQYVWLHALGLSASAVHVLSLVSLSDLS